MVESEARLILGYQHKGGAARAVGGAQAVEDSLCQACLASPQRAVQQNDVSGRGNRSDGLSDGPRE